MTTPTEQSITIDDVAYNFSDLNENAKNQVLNLQVTDQEIVRLQQRLAIFQTARAAYAQILKNELSSTGQ